MENKNCGREATLFRGGGQASGATAVCAKERITPLTNERELPRFTFQPRGRAPGNTFRFLAPTHTWSAAVAGHSPPLRQICTSGQFCAALPSVSLLRGVLRHAASQHCPFDSHWARAGNPRREASTADSGIRLPDRLAFGSLWVRWFDQFFWRATFAKSSTCLCERGH